jgi:monofunctional biosynthetic peptidoglycan transglycosylase
MTTLVARIMTTLPALAATAAVSAAGSLELDFDEGVDAWRVVVDGVMGGRSSGRVSLSEPGTLQFTGNLSLENNGGFSQMRANVPSEAFAGAEGIEIKVRGDGRTYKFDVRCSNVRLMAGGFQRDFQTEAGEWITIRLPFDEFRLYSFGRRVPNAPALEPTKIESIGVTLADKEPGAFRLEVDSIRTYGGQIPQAKSAGAVWRATPA